jgi:hypothetical protein
MKKVKVLIASCLAGSGHNNAADFLTSLLSADPRFEVVKYIHPGKYYDNTYTFTTKYSPFIHNFGVNYLPTLFSDIVTFTSMQFVDKCKDVLREVRPDILIVTHFGLFFNFKVAQWILKYYPVSVNIYMDWGEQATSSLPYNLNLRPDYGIVFDDVSLESVHKKLWMSKKYLITGGRKAKKEFFSVPKKYETRQEARKALKLKFNSGHYARIDPDKISVLIASGGGGIIQKTNHLLRTISKLQRKNNDLIDKFQFFVICGQNIKNYDKVMEVRSLKLSWQNVFPFGWVEPEDYALIQSASDYPVLFGVAPGTQMELLATACGPWLIHKIRGDHELGNVAWSVKNGFAEYIKDEKELLKRIFSPFKPARTETFRKKAALFLAKEDVLVKNMPDEIFRICNEKNPMVFQVYKAEIIHYFFSGFFTGLTLFIYYLGRFFGLLGKLKGKLAE